MSKRGYARPAHGSHDRKTGSPSGGLNKGPSVHRTTGIVGGKGMAKRSRRGGKRR